MDIVLCARDYTRLPYYFIARGNLFYPFYALKHCIIELFSRGKRLQQPNAAKVGEEID